MTIEEAWEEERNKKRDEINKKIVDEQVGKQSVRENVGKLRWDLVDWSSLEEMLKVLEAGANKYTEKNWQKGLHREEILESAQRHLVALFKKEEVDEELGTSHAANLMVNCMFYLYHKRNNSFSKTRNNPFNNNGK